MTKMLNFLFVDVPKRLKRTKTRDGWGGLVDRQQSGADGSKLKER